MASTFENQKSIFEISKFENFGFGRPGGGMVWGLDSMPGGSSAWLSRPGPL